MSDSVELNASVPSLINEALRLREEAERFASRAREVIAALASVDTEQNFPRDSFTEAFLPMYRGEGEKSNSEELRDATKTIGDGLSETITRLPGLLVGYVEADATGASGINRSDQG